MSRLKNTFQQLTQKNQKALVTFVTVGDPSLKDTEELIYTLDQSGVDIIELGIPFSDPMADGPVIQASSERALHKGVTLDKILKLVQKVRPKVKAPLVLMGYYNPIFVMGDDVFAQRAKQAGVDAVLIVDLPPEEGDSLRQSMKSRGMDVIYLLAPTSDDERIKKVAQKGSGFIYYVSLTGVTGAKLQGYDEVENQIEKIRQFTRLPLVVGFGVSKPEQVKQLARYAEGVVVGSALVGLIHQTADSRNQLHKKVGLFVKNLKKSTI